MDPLSLVMFGLIAVLIFFMFRNSKKRRQAMEDMQNNLRPGAEVMLQSGIFATVDSVDEEENRVTVRSGSSTLVVHRNAIGQILSPADAPAEDSAVAPDDDPEFGERIGELNDSQEASGDVESDSPVDPSESADTDSDNTNSNPDADASGIDENKKP